MIREQNFADLRRRYVESANTANARRTLDRFYGKKADGKVLDALLWLYRDHDASKKHNVHKPAEWDARESLDLLLEGYSVLEIASLAALIPGTFEPSFASRALLRLSHPAVVPYYETHYKQLLPRLFRRRLEGMHDLRDDVGDESETERLSLFVRFLDLKTLLDEDEQLEALLTVFDDFTWDGVDFEVLAHTLAKPQRLAEALFTDEDSGIHDVSHGLRKFLLFSTSLKTLLDDAAPFPLLQSAVWHFFEYWFQCLREGALRELIRALRYIPQWRLTPEMSAALLSLPETLGSPGEIEEREAAARAESITAVDSLESTLRFLVKPPFAKTLREADAGKYKALDPIEKAPLPTART